MSFIFGSALRLQNIKSNEKPHPSYREAAEVTIQLVKSDRFWVFGLINL
ncbi:MAG: hypothetical protein V7L26_34040 [Nostoc sp.]